MSDRGPEAEDRDGYEPLAVVHELVEGPHPLRDQHVPLIEPSYLQIEWKPNLEHVQKGKVKWNLSKNLLFFKGYLIDSCLLVILRWVEYRAQATQKWQCL